MTEWLPPEQFAIMAKRNEIARLYEEQGKIDLAIQLYEMNIVDAFFGTFPYDRLRIIYTRQRRYTDALRVCDAYLSLADRPHGQDKPHFQHHRDKLKAKLEEQ